MKTHVMGLSADIEKLIDWPLVLQQERYAGGHWEVMRNIFGPNAEVIAEWTNDDYQGSIAVAYRLSDGRVAVMTDYYGSCSGCDAWENCTEDEARKMISDLVKHCYVWPSTEAAKAGIEALNEQECPWQYPMIDAKNLLQKEWK